MAGVIAVGMREEEEEEEEKRTDPVTGKDAAILLMKSIYAGEDLDAATLRDVVEVAGQELGRLEARETERELEQLLV